MRVLFATIGSLGDLHPCLALAGELKRLGHTVVIASSEVHRARVLHLGLEFRSLRPNLDSADSTLISQCEDLKSGFEILFRKLILPHLADTYTDLLAAASECDFMLAGEIVYAAPLVADKIGLRWGSIILSPCSFLSAHDPSLLVPMPQLIRLRRLGWRVYRTALNLGTILTRHWWRPVKQLRIKEGLDPNWQAEERAREAAMPANRWLAERAAVQTQVPDGKVQQDRVVETPRQGYVERDEELNCTDGAFVTAIATLKARTRTWGVQSAELQEWARGQDAVFSNCSKTGTMPAPVQANWSALLRQDRAYQIAAAEFYTGNFDRARDDFAAIGNDRSSPWSRWGEYLAARAEVRKAARTFNQAQYGQLANFHQDGLNAAQTRLLKLEQESKDAEIRHAVAAELKFIGVRLDPSKRLDEAATALAAPDAEFKQDLIDLDFLMDHEITGNADLVK
jgi:Glycosyltransferase family 28 N-terminal domain